MQRSGKKYAKLFILCLSFLILSSTHAAQKLPTQNDITTLSEKTQSLAEDFMKKTASIRLSHFYSKKFISDSDRLQLCQIAKTASDDLNNICDTQRELLKQIDNYTQDDWDILFGQTGLWRKLYSDRQQTIWLKTQIDYFLALAESNHNRTRIIDSILENCNSDLEVFASPAAQLLLARATALKDPNCTEQFELLLKNPDTPPLIYFNTAAEYFNLQQYPDKNHLNKTINQLQKSNIIDNLDLKIKFAFLQCRTANSQLLTDIINRHPEMITFIGQIILTDLTRENQILTDKTFLEIALAVNYILQTEPIQYSQLLIKLCEIDSFKHPMIFSATAAALIPSNPEKALDCCLTAACLPNDPKTPLFDTSPAQLAQNAAKIACRLYQTNPEKYFAITDHTLDSYCTIAAENIDPEIQYFYAALLAEKKQTAKAAQMLKQIASQNSPYAKNAQFDLILTELSANPQNETTKASIGKQLQDFIESVKSTNPALHIKAIRLYCQLLLESSDPDRARQAINIINQAEKPLTKEINILLAQAQKNLGMFPQAVSTLVNAIEPNEPAAKITAAQLLSAILTNIDQYQDSLQNFSDFARNCTKLAEYCSKFEDKDSCPQKLIYIEFATIAATDQAELNKLQSMLNSIKDHTSIDCLRSQARLYMKQNKFDLAAQLWAQITAFHKPRNPAEPPSQLWWRAKYYQILCSAKSPKTSKDQTAHAIEILQNTFDTIPPFWAEKLAQLKTED